MLVMILQPPMAADKMKIVLELTAKHMVHDFQYR